MINDEQVPHTAASSHQHQATTKPGSLSNVPVGPMHPGDVGYSPFIPSPFGHIPLASQPPMLGPPLPPPPVWPSPPPHAWPHLHPNPAMWPAPPVDARFPGADVYGRGAYTDPNKKATWNGAYSYSAEPFHFTGPPPPEALVRQDPHLVNTGPPLHPLDSLAREARTVYVANIPNGMTEEQLMEWLECVERPVKVKLCGDSTKPAQFAFVEFPSVYGAHTAIGITGTDCCGHSLKVSQSRGTIQTPTAPTDMNSLPPEEQEIRLRTVYVNQLDSSLTEMYIREWFGERCGPVRVIKLCGDQNQPTRYGFIEFETLDAANVCKGLVGITLGNSPFRVFDSKIALSKPVPSGVPAVNNQQSRTVHIGNLDRCITEGDLRSFFEQCGAVAQVYIVAGDPLQPVRYGFVEFVEYNSMIKAFALSGQVLGQYGIRVSPAKGVIGSGATKAATLPGIQIQNPAAQEAINVAYAAALQAENLKYQQYLARKHDRASDSSSNDSRRRRHKHRRRSRSGSRRRRRKRSHSTGSGQKGTEVHK
eukprot:GGOE01020728.1.p1 GENE.GGOE01020728.1~~GGOE01020728.1.p1  ORF type:complete len:533 (-),score=66.04 GGOE01020728.1:118-1716(-)